jgi:excisionase family DNA binding protein
MTAIPADSVLDGVLAVSVCDAARAIGISRSSLYLLFAQRKLKSLKIGKRRLVEIAEVERFLAAHRVEYGLAP